jgi:hypothetical protein
MQVVNDGAAPQIKEMLAAAAVASTMSLPATNVCEGVFHRYPLSQLGSALWCQLPFTQLLEAVLA